MDDGPATSGGPATGAVESTDGAAAPVETPPTGSRKWYRSWLGIAIAAFDTGLLVAVVVGTTGLLGSALEFAGLPAVALEVTVPAYVYAFGILGALGYVFMSLVRDYHRELADLAHVNLRIGAAVPLAAGLYLLVGQFLGETPPERLIAGLALVTGLFVDLAYKRIDALAHRLLPEEEIEEGIDDGNADHAGHPHDADGERPPDAEDGPAS